MYAYNNCYCYTFILLSNHSEAKCNQQQQHKFFIDGNLMKSSTLFQWTPHLRWDIRNSCVLYKKKHTQTIEGMLTKKQQLDAVVALTSVVFLLQPKNEKLADFYIIIIIVHTHKNTIDFPIIWMFCCIVYTLLSLLNLLHHFFFLQYSAVYIL